MMSMSRRTVLTTPAVAVLAACGTDRSGAGQSGTDPDPSATPTASTPSIDLSGVGEDVTALVDDVSIDRLTADVATLARGPRHVVENTEAAREAADHVRAELATAGLEPQRIDVESQGVTLPVVWAEVVGTDCPERVLVLTGHYDTVPGSPGADDDASGVAGMLEVARVLAEAELPGSVVLAGLPFEEQGLPYPGSAALAEDLITRQGRTVIGMISAEMLGYALPEPHDEDPGDYLMLLGYEGAETLVHTVAAACTEWVGDFTIAAATHPPETDFISRSDHAAFHAVGVPAAFATDGANFRTPYYHTPDDVPDNIVVDFLYGSVRGLLAGVVAVVSLDAREVCTR